ncbi:MAG: sugar ABC transporter permease, partial [Pseudomonadota bacterium]
MSPAPTRTALPSQARTAWAFVVPFFLVLSIFVLGPTLAVIGLSVSDWKLGEREITFVGLQNYDELFGDRIFWNSAQNTAVYTLMVVPVSVALGVWLAVLIESSRFGRTFFRSAI